MSLVRDSAPGCACVECRHLGRHRASLLRAVRSGRHEIWQNGEDCVRPEPSPRTPLRGVRAASAAQAAPPLSVRACPHPAAPASAACDCTLRPHHLHIEHGLQDNGTLPCRRRLRGVDRCHCDDTHTTEREPEGPVGRAGPQRTRKSSLGLTRTRVPATNLQLQCLWRTPRVRARTVRIHSRYVNAASFYIYIGPPRPPHMMMYDSGYEFKGPAPSNSKLYGVLLLAESEPWMVTHTCGRCVRWR